MSLLRIKETVQKIADAIANVLNLDVIIVNSEMAIIGNTYTIVEEYDINIHMESIVGDTVQSGNRQVFLDKSTREQCRFCEYSQSCRIGGVLSVPIIWQKRTVGAIGVIFSSVGASSWVTEHEKGVVEFLENMASLLGSKLDSVSQIEQIEKSQFEKELIIETISDALVFIDKDGHVVYRNSLFNEYFCISGDITSTPILQILNHQTIAAHLGNRRNITDKIFVFDNAECQFLGLVSCRNIKVHGNLIGSILVFRKIEEAYRLVHELSGRRTDHDFHTMVCESTASLELIDQAKEMAVRDDHLVILGSRGSGKEHLAGAIHRFSNRKKKYFFTVECGKLSRDKYLSSFFGIGENEAQVGEFHLANGGTLILKEICDLPLSIQKDFAEYLSDGEINLENGMQVKNIDIRFIATSSISLIDKVRSGDLLEDLYFRLRENTLHVPDLQKRSVAEFRAFVNLYLDKYRDFYDCSVEFEPDAFDALTRYSWPNNLNELAGVLEKLVVRFPGEKIHGVDVEDVIYSKNRLTNSEDVLNIEEYEKHIISNAIQRYGGERNAKSLAADKLGISRATLYRKLKKYNLEL